MKQERWSWRRFFYGAVGALAPEAVRWYNIVRFGGQPLHVTLAYVVWSLVFIAIGGVFASAWGDNHAYKCLYIGATFPILVSAWGKNTPVR